MKTTLLLAFLITWMSHAHADAKNAPGSFDFTLLPEQTVAESPSGDVTAFYATPTEKYQHGILGDAIEASQLIVKKDENFYQLNLSNDEVFEDITPRLYDVDNDGELEFITIRTNINAGAAISIYKLENGKLSEYARTPAIGLRNRWLNIAAIADLDNDGEIEIAWVQTPHIGGILKVANIKEGRLVSLDNFEFVSNHAIGERNLDLSVLSEKDGEKTLYLPSQQRDSVIGFQLVDDQWLIKENFSQTIDFSTPLRQQIP